MKFYFAGAIRGGREDARIYQRIIKHLARHGAVLTEHVGSTSPTPDDDRGMDDRAIHDRDLAWLKASDCLVAETSVPSLGVGYEIATALASGIPVVVLHRSAGPALSAMISGAPSVRTLPYEELDAILAELDVVLGDLDALR